MTADSCSSVPDYTATEEPHDDIVSTLSLAGGQMLSSLRVLWNLDAHEIVRVSRHVQSVVHWYDLLLIILLGWFLVPTARLVHTAFAGVHVYDQSYTRSVLKHVAQMAQLSALIYLADIIVVALVAIGFDFNVLSTYSLGFARVLYVAWAAARLSALKRHVLEQAAAGSPHKLGQLGLVDRLVDGLLFGCFGFLLLDILDVQMGFGLSSIFAFGSAGTLLLGLASKDLADMFFNGLAMTTADRVREGDCVKFGDGTDGRILKIGWMMTTLRHYDDTTETIPNSRLGMQRVVNMSRAKQCQVKLQLRFPLTTDGHKLEQVAADILEEIKASCPQAIIDGSRPFRAVFSDIKEYYLQLTVDTHYDLPAMGGPYHNNRQEVNKAILRAVAKNGLTFAQPPAVAAPL